MLVKTESGRPGERTQTRLWARAQWTPCGWGWTERAIGGSALGASLVAGGGGRVVGHGSGPPRGSAAGRAGRVARRALCGGRVGGGGMRAHTRGSSLVGWATGC